MVTNTNLKKTEELSLLAAEEGLSPNRTPLSALATPFANADLSPPANNASNSNNSNNDPLWETSTGDEKNIPAGQGEEPDETPKGGDGSIHGCLRDWHCKLTILYICGWIYFIFFLKSQARYGHVDSCFDADDFYANSDDCPFFWVDLWFLAVSAGMREEVMAGCSWLS